MPSRAPTVAELQAEIGTRAFRRGVGSLFAVGAATPFAKRFLGSRRR